MKKVQQTLGLWRSNISFVTALSGVGRAVRTLFFVPEHDSSYYEGVAMKLRSTKQLTQPAVTNERIAVRQLLSASSLYRPATRLTQAQLLGFMGVLMQFTLHLPKLTPFYQVHYSDVETLYQECVKQGASTPLTFHQQLEIALKQTSGDLPEALWRLFVTSRLYTRWLDTGLVTSMPELRAADIQNRMAAWSTSFAACKPADSCVDQDVAGDVYYCWTHAFAKVAYQVLPTAKTPLTYIESWALHYGTALNHGILHKFAPQRMQSNHYTAAAYGNAIGQECVAHQTKT